MDKKYTMAELLAEYGDGFDKMEDESNNEPAEEVKPEETKTEPEVEEKTKEPQDIMVKCKKCENEFIWTVRDQEFYKEKGFRRPVYCKDCRKKIKVVNNFHKDM